MAQSVEPALRRRRGEKEASSESEGEATTASPGKLAAKQVRKSLLRLLARPASYTTVFVLGFVCSLILWPHPVRQKVQSAGQTLSRAYERGSDHMGDVVESMMNGTVKLREVLENQAEAVSGRMKDASVGIKDLLSTMKVPIVSEEGERVGLRMRNNGAEVHSPVVMVPGIITTGLEVWDGEACIRSYFRQRIWGSSTMLQAMLSDPECWVRHLALNATTGLDPLQAPHFNKSIRVRPSQGFESADFFVAGYWLWGILIEALADIGYDLNSMHMASYDWRLSFGDLERRDRYFTRLRQQIETLVHMNGGKKAVVVGHSMGSNVWHYFMQWVTHNVHANWVHDYIRAEVDISSPLLGLPKAYYSLLTGDNRDFASMGRGFSAVMTHLFGPMTRRRLWRSCSSLVSMIPIGGDKIWGKAFTGTSVLRVDGAEHNVTEAYDLLAKEGTVPEDLQRIAPWLLDGVRQHQPQYHGRPGEVPPPPEHVWANALAVPLPFAPALRKYAFYGVGVPTDVSAHVKETGDDQSTPRFSIDREATKSFGFDLADGDYAVPVQSLGLMCLKGWRNDRRNPARIPCTIREYADNPQGGPARKGDTSQAAKAAGASPSQLMTALLTGGYSRGGQPSGDHIDILGNEEMLEDLLTVVSGGDVDGRIVSDIQAIADRWVDE